MDKKALVAAEAIKYVNKGNVVGLGSGTTVNEFIKLLGTKEEIKKTIVCVATSIATENLARKVGIRVIDIDLVDRIDVTIDGADEIDPDGNLLKGGGGALTREKKVALNSSKYVIIASNEKLVEKIPDHMGIPIEILKFGAKSTIQKIEDLGMICRVRENFITDNGNIICDCIPENSIDLRETNDEIKKINGVVETGLFLDMRKIVITSDGENVKITSF